jgi:hypothetical protein
VVFVAESISQLLVFFTGTQSRLAELALGFTGACRRAGIGATIPESPSHGLPAGCWLQ